MGISRDKWHKRRASGGKRTTLRMKRKFELGRQPANTKLGERRVHQVRCRGGYIKFRALKVDHGNYAWPGEAVTRKTRIVAVVYNPTNPEYVRTNTIVKGTIVQIDATPFKNWYQKHYGVTVGGGAKAAFEKVKPAKKTRRHRAAEPVKVKVAKVVAEKSDKPKKVVKPAAKVDATPVAKPKTETPVVAKPAEKKRIIHHSKNKPVKKVVPEGEKKVSERKCKATNNSRSSTHRPSGAMLKRWRLRNATRVLESALEEQFQKNRLYAKVSTSPGQTGSADGYVLEGVELAFYVKRMQHKKKK
jgi:small subunit ribosomal protein S8e